MRKYDVARSDIGSNVYPKPYQFDPGPLIAALALTWPKHLEDRDLQRAYYSAAIAEFVVASADTVLGHLLMHSEFEVNLEQSGAWLEQIRVMQMVLRELRLPGVVHFEYVLPRFGRRIDVVLVVSQAVFVLEFKVGDKHGDATAMDQVWDYALDLKNFHEASHQVPVIPMVVPTAFKPPPSLWHQPDMAPDGVARPTAVSPSELRLHIEGIISALPANALRAEEWIHGRYAPTPTIVEAATALYAGHSVEEIARSGAEARNLGVTSSSLERLIGQAQRDGKKLLCLVTGVPGAGKTLVGLDVAHKHQAKSDNLHSVFLSGNGPLVAVLREALVRDTINRSKLRGERLTKKIARQGVESMIQNVHHFRDDCLRQAGPPIEHVAIFDEAQRAWDRDQTSKFMRRKRGMASFDQSEAEFLLSCLDRHTDWAVVVCLVGGGQEIHTGEAGIAAWIDALLDRFPDWQLHLPVQLRQTEYRAEAAICRAQSSTNTVISEQLHLATSMRSFRATGLSDWVRTVLDLEEEQARVHWAALLGRFPVYLTRDLTRAKVWLKERMRGTERAGLVVSSQALRLKPHAIDVRAPVDPVHWFLGPKTDIRSSTFLEDAATEFQVQGLELDWACLVWDADFRRTTKGWEHWSFIGEGWKRVLKAHRQAYLKNAYRVLLTRARQGLVICVPEGDEGDPTRLPEFYDGTFAYLRSLGLPLMA